MTSLWRTVGCLFATKIATSNNVPNKGGDSATIAKKQQQVNPFGELESRRVVVVDLPREATAQSKSLVDASSDEKQML